MTDLVAGQQGDPILGANLPPPYLQRFLPGRFGEISGYAGVSIDAAVNLLEAREYANLDRPARLHTALVEQQQFLSGLLGYAGRAAFDLRLTVRPGWAIPIELSLLARVWSDRADHAHHEPLAVRDQMFSSLPKSLVASVIDDPCEVRRRLDVHQDTPRLEAAVITKREVIGQPSRPDAGRDWYFSVVPFSWLDVDWTSVYRLLSASSEPLTISVGLFPTALPAWFSTELSRIATYYGRLAREDEQPGGLYFGPRRLPPDAFAVDAQRVFAEYLQRCSETAYVFRVLVAAPRLDAGVAEALGAAIAPADAGAGTHLQSRAGATHDVRWLTGAGGEHVARWNLAALDCYPAPGRPEIWGRRDRLPPHLEVLSVLGDATEAACAFRFPVAVDGVVPGFRVRRGQFGHAESTTPTGASVTVGQLAGTNLSLCLPLASLTKHALVAGSTGSGKTTTVLELLRQLWVEHRVPFLVLEPVSSELDDYRRLLAVDGFEALRVLTLGDERGAPLRFNPFQVPPGVLVSEHIANLLACFKAAFGLWEPLPSIYQQALDCTYLTSNVLFSEVADDHSQRWPTVVEFLHAMAQTTAALNYAGDVKANIEAASIRRAEQLIGGACASTFLTDAALDLSELMSRPTILELKSLGNGDEQSLMIALLLNAMTEHYKANRRPSGTLQHVTVIEEAHRLLTRPQGGAQDPAQAQSKERAAADFANALAENRKYGEGMIIAEQIPTKLVEDALKNTNLKIMHRTTAEEDRLYLGRSMGLDDAQLRFATRLGAGEALVYSDELPESAHVDIRRTVGEELPRPESLAAPPFVGCAPCRAKCRYRGASMAMVRDPRLREQLSTTRADVAKPETDQTVLRRRWDRLAEVLRNRVRSYPALPSEEPEVSDAAFCLFLHGLATESMTYSSRWPQSVARQLGIPVDGASNVR